MNSSKVSDVHSLSNLATVCLWATIIVSMCLIIKFGLFSKPPLSWLFHKLSRTDLVLHAVAFAGLALPAFVLFRPMIKTAVGIFALGAGLELVQWASTSREASMSDLMANGLGIALAAFAIVTLRRLDFAILPQVLRRTS